MAFSMICACVSSVRILLMSQLVLNPRHVLYLCAVRVFVSVHKLMYISEKMRMCPLMQNMMTRITRKSTPQVDFVNSHHY